MTSETLALQYSGHGPPFRGKPSPPRGMPWAQQVPVRVGSSRSELVGRGEAGNPAPPKESTFVHWNLMELFCKGFLWKSTGLEFGWRMTFVRNL